MATPKPCTACTHSYMEPDSDLICGLPELGLFGLTIRKNGEHCEGGKKFDQHPLRTPEGHLKRGTK